MTFHEAVDKSGTENVGFSKSAVATMELHPAVLCLNLRSFPLKVRDLTLSGPPMTSTVEVALRSPVRWIQSEVISTVRSK